MAATTTMPGIKVRLLKPMAIGDAPEARPVGFEHVVTEARARRWINQGLAEDPTGKIQPDALEQEAPDKKKSRKAKEVFGEDD